MPTAHWTMVIAPLLTALHPRLVAAGGLDARLVQELTELGQAAGYSLVDACEPDAEAIVAGPRIDVDFELDRPLELLVGWPEVPGTALAQTRSPRTVIALAGLTASARSDALRASPDLGCAWASLGEIRGLESVVDQLEAGEAELDRALHSLDAAATALRDSARRERRLERQLERANSVASTAELQLATERAWVARQVALVEASQSWRLGHRLVRILRTLTMRRDASTDALSVVVRQLGDADRESMDE